MDIQTSGPVSKDNNQSNSRALDWGSNIVAIVVPITSPAQNSRDIALAFSDTELIAISIVVSDSNAEKAT